MQRNFIHEILRRVRVPSSYLKSRMGDIQHFFLPHGNDDGGGSFDSDGFRGRLSGDDEHAARVRPHIKSCATSCHEIARPVRHGWSTNIRGGPGSTPASRPLHRRAQFQASDALHEPYVKRGPADMSWLRSMYKRKGNCWHRDSFFFCHTGG